MAPKNVEYLEIAQQRLLEKKTHVSFPQLKYPSLRDEGWKDPLQWLKGKIMDDNAEGLWRVHDKIYDLTPFVSSHPGGAEWLEISKGTDITEVFECHHLNPVVYKVLEKYYVKDAEAPRNSPFSFKDDGFYRTLKRDVIEELKKIPKNVSDHTDRIQDGLLAGVLLFSALSVWSTNYTVSMITYLAASVSLAWLTVISHNYIHQKTNWRMYLFNLSLWSYRDFRISHVFSHHVYPNTLMDLEISAFEPFIAWIPMRSKPIMIYLTPLVQFVGFPFVFIHNFIQRFAMNFIYKDYFTQHYRWHDAFGFLLPLWMYIVTGCTLYEVIYTWLLLVCTASWCFFMIASHAAHHDPRVFLDGDEVRELYPDWGVHELQAVMDRKDINGNLFTVVTMFGDHALHHLFPTLDHAVLRYLYPVFLKNVEKFKTKFNLTTALDLAIGQYRLLAKTSPALLED